MLDSRVLRDQQLNERRKQRFASLVKLEAASIMGSAAPSASVPGESTLAPEEGALGRRGHRRR